MKHLLRISGLLCFAAILVTAAVKTDYSHSTDFGRYKTYTWLKVEAENSLWQDRIQRSVDAELTAKGWHKTASGGDASLTAIGSVKTERRFDTFYNGFGGGWYWRGFGDTATTTEQSIPIGSLVIDVFDSTSKKLIWRGTAEKTLSGDPEKNEKKLKDAVQDMFKKFPPPSKG